MFFTAQFIRILTRILLLSRLKFSVDIQAQMGEVRASVRRQATACVGI